RPPSMTSLCAVLAASTAVACTETDLSPAPDVVFALFDPAASPPQLPLPNDIAMFGAHPSTPTTASFTQPLATASLRVDDVIAINLSTSMPILGATPSFDPANNRLIVLPPAEGWPLGRVAIALRGG